MNTSVQKCPPPVALPIIFVPGIMGSRLRRTSNRASIWDPDRTKNALGLAWAGASGKRAKLVGASGSGFSPGYLEVDPGSVTKTLSTERIDRGWGGVLQSFYYGFLAWLDHTAETPAAGQVPKGCFNLHYEVWVHPYNWTDDNSNSGRKLAATVQNAISGTRAKYAGKNIRILKPILITHSMGGLVARAYTQLHNGGAQVHGVIHGAMPTDGVPATYKRIRAGFEGGGFSGTIERHALGANQREATASAGNLPGPLQLLPNGRHRTAIGGSTWLQTSNANGDAIWRRPGQNPYAEIYANQNDWWRLIDKDLLDPDARDPGKAFSQFLAQLLKAKRYHDALGRNGFHPNTRMFYSRSNQFKAWDHIDWRQTIGRGNPPNMQPNENNGRGRVSWGTWSQPVTPMMAGAPTFLPNLRYELQGADAVGDGTVHAGSGEYASGPMTEATRNGFEHAGAFNPTEVRRLVAEWIFDMVEEQL